MSYQIDIPSFTKSNLSPYIDHEIINRERREEKLTIFATRNPYKIFEI